jgi:Holliday junction DNA helicase RuvA
VIYKLTGIVDEISDNHLVLDVGGVGYGIFAPIGTLAHLAPKSPANLYIEMVVKEDGVSLYGFSAAAEKAFFNLLTTVQGVGPKAAMAILSALPLEQAVSAILAGDSASLAKANGIGAKTAVRIASELKDKVAKLGLDLAVADVSKTITNSDAGDAISALTNLGYSRTEAAAAVAKTLEAEQGLTVGDIIRKALARFS